jgi:rod shape-determining protein MreB
VAILKDTGKVLAVGAEAQRMLGKTPANIVAMRPLKEGVIADFDKTGEMLKYFIRKVHNRKSFISPRVVIGVPSGITQVEQRAVKDAAHASGAREIYLIEEPMAAALGVGLPIGEPSGSMIVDIGGGTTDVAVISLHGVVFSKAVRVGGDKMDEAIVNHIKSKTKILIGDRTAEMIKRELGSAYKVGNGDRSIEVKGRDLVSGIPKTITVYEDEIREAISEPVTVIINTIKVALENTPPELASDLPVIIAEDPLSAVVNGVGKVLDDLDILSRVTI